MTDCPKLAKRRKIEEDQDAEKCQNCNTPGHEEENCYCGEPWRTTHTVDPNRNPKKSLRHTNKHENR